MQDYSFSLRRESDRRFKVLITVPESKGDWRYSDFELEVFDRKNRKLPAHPARKPDAPLVTAWTRSPGRSHALYTLNTEVPARATLRVKGKTFELTSIHPNCQRTNCDLRSQSTPLETHSIRVPNLQLVALSWALVRLWWVLEVRRLGGFLSVAVPTISPISQTAMPGAPLLPL